MKSDVAQKGLSEVGFFLKKGNENQKRILQHRISAQKDFSK